MAAWNFLRPLGRAQLGASAGLKGNGMVFAADVAQRYEWSASLTEDLEYHTKLILGGERATFAPDAQVWAEMPATLAAARTQQMRWERGRLETARHYIPLLLREALIRRSFLLFDAAVEQLIPPFSIIAAISVMSLTVALALRDGVGIVLAALMLIGQVIYILAGVSLARVPRHVSRALLYAPVFIVWKFWIYGRVLIDRQQNSWIRTTRNHS
jgi:cellulose synthase/poly-beta-1,6-N-acetylglucosamine synthase-like glycosyltransferase